MSNILVIDDDVVILKLISDFLENKGFTVKQALNKKIAINELVENKVNAIIVNLKAPETFGVDVILFCKNNFPKIPVFILTQANAFQSYEDTLGVGNIAHVFKLPPDMHEIEKALREIK
jgi:DNA-binding NtrC family response regulator